MSSSGTCPLPTALREEITQAYARLAHEAGRTRPDVAARSSATAEDLPEASFAGQQETFLNVRGPQALLDACHRCNASLFTDRAIDYRERLGFDQLSVALSIGVQLMARSDLGGAGVMFTLDTETGFPEAVVINAAWGLGESVGSGQVDPDEYVAFKPLLKDPALNPVIRVAVGGKHAKVVYAEGGLTRIVDTDPAERTARVLDDEARSLAEWAVAVERHHGTPMDLEWAKDGRTGEMFVVQARPETVRSRRTAAVLRRYRLTGTGECLATGVAVGEAVGAGPVCALASRDPTQLALGVDRDSAELSGVFDETDGAVTRSIEALIATAHDAGRPVGLRGQRPSDDPGFAAFLVKAGIDSISVAPDSFVPVKQHVAAAE